MTWVLFLIFYFIFITGVFVGMLVGYFAHKHLVIAQTPKKSPEVAQQTIEKPAGIFSDLPETGEAEIVMRPSAKDLEVMNEPEEKKRAKDAMRETFANNAEFQKIKALHDDFVKGVTNG